MLLDLDVLELYLDDLISWKLNIHCHLKRQQSIDNNSNLWFIYITVCHETKLFSDGLNGAIRTEM